MAASAAVASCSLSSPSLTIDGRALVSPTNVHTCSISRESNWKTTAFCRRIASNFVTKVSTGETTAEVVVETPAQVATESSTEVTTELPEVLKTIQEAWDKVEDKYAVVSLGVAGTIALVGSTGVISAIDRLPLIPGVLELVGICRTEKLTHLGLPTDPTLPLRRRGKDCTGTAPFFLQEIMKMDDRRNHHSALDDLNELLVKADRDLLLVQRSIDHEFQATYPDHANPCKIIGRIKKIQDDLVTLKGLCIELLKEKQDLIDKATVLNAQKSYVQRLLASSGLPLMNDSDETTYSNLDQVINEWENQVRIRAGDEKEGEEDINEMLFAAIVHKH